MRRASLSAGLALIASAALWQLGLARRWTQRIPVGWRTASHYVGTATYPDPKTGRLPEGGELARYDRTQRVSSDAGRPRWVEFEDRYTVRDAATGHIVFDYTTRDTVDPLTGAHLEAHYRGDVALFPRDVQRRTYRLRTNYVTSIPLTFERQDVLEGLTTYLFSYRGRLVSARHAMKRPRISLATKALAFQLAGVLAIAGAVALPRYFSLRAGLHAGIESSAESLVQVLEDLVSEHPELLRPGALDAVIDRF